VIAVIFSAETNSLVNMAMESQINLVGICSKGLAAHRHGDKRTGLVAPGFDRGHPRLFAKASQQREGVATKKWTPATSRGHEARAVACRSGPPSYPSAGASNRRLPVPVPGAAPPSPQLLSRNEADFHLTRFSDPRFHVSDLRNSSRLAILKKIGKLLPVDNEVL
jgi:hypothetical protein